MAFYSITLTDPSSADNIDITGLVSCSYLTQRPQRKKILPNGSRRDVGIERCNDGIGSAKEKTMSKRLWIHRRFLLLSVTLTYMKRKGQKLLYLSWSCSVQYLKRFMINAIRIPHPVWTLIHKRSNVQILKRKRELKIRTLSLLGFP